MTSLPESTLPPLPPTEVEAQLAEVDLEKTRLLFRNAGIAQVVSVTNSAVLVFVLGGLAPPLWAVGWWLLAAVTAAGRYLLARSFLRTQPSVVEGARWRRRALWSAAAAGLVWSGGGIAFMVSGSEATRLFTALVLAGMVAGAVPILSAVPAAFHLYAAQVTLAIIGTALLDARSPRDWMLALVATLYLLALLRSARYFHDILDSSIQLGLRMGRMAERLDRVHQDAEAASVTKSQLLAEREAAEEKIRGQEEEIRAVVDNLVDGVINIDDQGIVRSFNRSAERIFGYAAKEVIGQSVNMIVPEPHRRQHDRYLDKYLRSGEAHIIGIGREVEGQRKDGQLIALDLAVNEYRMKGKHYFTGTLRDITERKRVSQELKQTTQKAEDANRAKSDFLAIMSHELRTPMNGILGMIDVIGHTELNSDQREMMETVRESAFSLLGIIDDILDFSKIEAGKLEMERVPVSIANLVENVCETLAPIAQRKSVELLVYTDPSLPDSVVTDPMRLRQVLFNLAGNAVKFTVSAADKAGAVGIRAEVLKMTETNVSVCLRITDNGIGMTQETLAQLFKPFTQAESSTTRHFGGTGLGLSISKRLTQLMGGKIEVHSERGLGSTFRVLLDFEIARGVAAASDRQFDVRDLSVVVLAATGELRDILVSHLTYGGAQIIVAEQADDALLQASAAKRSGRPFVIVVVDKKSNEAQTAELQRKFLAHPDLGNTHFVVIERGRRRAGRMVGPDSVMIDANAMRRSAFLRAVAAAAGRVLPETAVQPDLSTAPVDRFPSVPEAEAAGSLILVAEDNKTNQKVIMRQLHLLGYAVELADNGREALSLWQNKRYGLVFTDCHMPEMDGFEFAAALRREEGCSGRHTPLVAITANALKGEREHCLAAGMDDYLAKPVPLVALRDTLARWLPAANAVPGEALRNEPAADAGGNPINAAVNPDALKEIVGDDPAIVAEFLSDFVLTAREAVGEIQVAYRARAAQEIAAFAHKLKSSARTVGADSLADLCQALEQAGKLGDWAAIDMSMPRLDPGFAAVEHFIGVFVGQEH